MKLKLCLVGLAFFFSIGISSAQRNNIDKSTFIDAEFFFISEDYTDALIAYTELLRKNPENGNLNYHIGLCLLNIEGKKTEAIPYLEDAAKTISDKYTTSNFTETTSPPQTLFLLGTAYQINNQLDKAETAFNDYKTYLDIKDVYEIDFVDKQIKSLGTARRYMNEPVKLECRILDEIIPQRAANYNPVLSADGDMLIFIYSLKFYAAVYMVRKNNGEWTDRVNITPQLMSDGDCFPTSLTGDGKTMYLVKKTEFESNIYLSHFDGIMWSPIEKLAKPINSNSYESHAGISADGNTLYFTSNRKKGLGGLDIYSSKKNAAGNWETPLNLGNTINTEYNEDTPFILGDDKTLFFASQGHDGMGMYDTYKSINQGGNNWSVPQNLGYPWNTTDNNVFFYPIGNGEKALYAGIIDKEEKRNSIKELSLVKTANITKKKIELKGVISYQDNSDSDNNLQLKIRESDDSIKAENDIAFNKQTGEFSTMVEPGKYSVTVKAENYKSINETVELNEDFNRSDFIVNLDLISEDIGSGEYISIKNIFFDFNSFDLNQEAKLEIERLYRVMIDYPELCIEVIGHSDSKGDPDYNFELSEKRAKSVIDYLVSKGVELMRFQFKGVGEIENIAINLNPDGSDNPEGRKRNRNVSIKILDSEDHNIVVEAIHIPDHLKPKSQTIYTIFLAESNEVLDNYYFKDINSVITEGIDEVNQNSKYVYSFGKFYSYSDAKDILQSQILSKFADAKIVNAESMQIVHGQTTQIAGSSSFKFGIQIHAFKDPDNAAKIKNLVDFVVYKCNDGFYRVVSGNYINRTEAEEGLNYLRENGYADAFIVDRDLLNKVVIE